MSGNTATSLTHISPHYPVMFAYAGSEVAFLTSIPYANITHYQAPNNPAWIAMP